MSLTLSPAPLSSRPGREVNYALDGPAHLLFLDDFPRRVRAELAGRVVADTNAGRLLHESNLLPVLYIPDADLDDTVLEPTTHTTHCPFKGDAAYWTVRGGDRTAENAVWAYPAPIAAAAWLQGYKAIDWASMDAWYDEDEQVFGHLRDPYHRVDVRRTGRQVRVWCGDELLVESERAKVLSETGLPNRFYIPREDVRIALRASETSAVCPYKGRSSYWSMERHGKDLADLAWSYQDPLEEVATIAGHLCFLHDELTVTVE